MEKNIYLFFIASCQNDTIDEKSKFTPKSIADNGKIELFNKFEKRYTNNLVRRLYKRRSQNYESAKIKLLTHHNQIYVTYLV